jgi:hypothetical protein
MVTFGTIDRDAIGQPPLLAAFARENQALGVDPLADGGRSGADHLADLSCEPLAVGKGSVHQQIEAVVRRDPADELALRLVAEIGLPPAMAVGIAGLSPLALRKWAAGGNDRAQQRDEELDGISGGLRRALLTSRLVEPGKNAPVQTRRLLIGHRFGGRQSSR